MIDDKKCKNCGKKFKPSKNDKRIVFCCTECRIEYRQKTNYMGNYYHANLKSWKERQSTEEYRDAKNKARRLKYATDDYYRERNKLLVKKYYKENPDKKLAQRMKKFGITVEQYNEMFSYQGGKCAICGSQVGDENGNRLYVDHNHKTGKVRGLLCSSCNFGIGKFRDDPNLLKKAIVYLETRDGTNIDMV